MGYERPAELGAALARLAAGPAVLLAGGTDLYAMTDRPALAGPVVDLTGIAALRGVEAGPAGVRIGACATWAEVAVAALPPACDGLRAAAREVGSVQIQNRGTVGGNLCNASPAADGVPPLLTLGAEVELAGPRGLRRLPLAAFLLGPRRTARAADEVLAAVHLSASALGGRGAFEKLGARRHLVISIVMVAARVTVAAGRIETAAVAVGACSAVARRLPAVEAALVGQPATAPRIDAAAVADALAPLDDIRADAAYRRRAAAELVGRAVRRAAEGGA